MLVFGLAIATSAFAAKPIKKPLTQAQIDADNENRAGPIAEEAVKAFQDSEFAKALKLFDAAYAIAPKKPLLLFNMGRCLEEMGRLKEALQKFQECIVLPNLDEPIHKAARARITKLEMILHPPAAPPIVIEQVTLPPATTVVLERVGLPVAATNTTTQPTPLIVSSILTGALLISSAAVAVVAHEKFATSEDVFANITKQADVDTYMTALSEYKTWRNARNSMFIAGGVGTIATGFLMWQHFHQATPNVRVHEKNVFVVPTWNGVTLALKF